MGERSRFVEVCGAAAAYLILVALLASAVFFVAVEKPYGSVESMEKSAHTSFSRAFESASALLHGGRGGHRVEIVEGNAPAPLVAQGRARVTGKGASPLRRSLPLADVHRAATGRGEAAPAHAAAWAYVLDGAGRVLVARPASGPCAGKLSVVEAHRRPLEKAATAAARELHDVYGIAAAYEDMTELMPERWLRTSIPATRSAENQLTSHLVYRMLSASAAGDAAAAAAAPAGQAPAGAATSVAGAGAGPGDAAPKAAQLAPSQAPAAAAPRRFLSPKDLAALLRTKPGAFCSPDHVAALQLGVAALQAAAAKK